MIHRTPRSCTVGPITLIDSTGHAARIAIDAPPAVTIMRDELVPDSCLR